MKDFDISIFDLDWNKDFPQGFACAKPKLPEEFSDEKLYGVPNFIGFGYSPSVNELTYRVQADPDDKLEFFEPVLGQREHHSTSMIWYYTLDYYVFQYYCLMERHHGSKKHTIELPEEVAEKYKGRLGRTKATQKYLPINTDVFEAVKTDGRSKAQTTTYQLPSYTRAAFLNLLCRYLWVREDAIRKKSSLYFNGIKFKHKDFPDFIPPFLLEDYIEHERQTGLSLSIEITAVLLEFEDASIRDNAFIAFCCYLPWIVHSPMFFTRNTVSRHFFQQILLEEKFKKYCWCGSKDEKAFSDYQWNAIVHRAKQHLYILQPAIIPVDVPDEQLDAAIEHIEKLLSEVKLPVNLPEYVKHPQYGLAAFCHPAHEKIDDILKQLTVSDLKDTTDIPRSRADCAELFFRVHRRIQEAILSPDYSYINEFLPHPENVEKK